MSVGRPTKYDPKYCEMLVEHMEQGLSFESFGGVVSVSKQTLYDWEKAHPEFLDAKKEATLKSMLFWEKKGLEGLYTERGVSFNSTVWIFNMKNRFSWRDQPAEPKDETKEQPKIIINMPGSKDDRSDSGEKPS